MALTVGWIPVDATAELITVGDPSLAGTLEMDLEIINEQIRGVGFDYHFDTTGLNWFDNQSGIFKALAALISSRLGQTGPPTRLLAYAWALFQWELEEDVPELILVGEEETAGEFTNPAGLYNGCFYLRYFVEDGTEVFGEKTVVLNRTDHA